VLCTGSVPTTTIPDAAVRRSSTPAPVPGGASGVGITGRRCAGSGWGWRTCWSPSGCATWWRSSPTTSAARDEERGRGRLHRRFLPLDFHENDMGNDPAHDEVQQTGRQFGLEQAHALLKFPTFYKSASGDFLFELVAHVHRSLTFRTECTGQRECHPTSRNPAMQRRLTSHFPPNTDVAAWTRCTDHGSSGVSIKCWAAGVKTSAHEM